MTYNNKIKAVSFIPWENEVVGRGGRTSSVIMLDVIRNI